MTSSSSGASWCDGAQIRTVHRPQVPLADPTCCKTMLWQLCHPFRKMPRGHPLPTGDYDDCCRCDGRLQLREACSAVADLQYVMSVRPRLNFRVASDTDLACCKSSAQAGALLPCRCCLECRDENRRPARGSDVDRWREPGRDRDSRRRGNSSSPDRCGRGRRRDGSPPRRGSQRSSLSPPRRRRGDDSPTRRRQASPSRRRELSPPRRRGDEELDAERPLQVGCRIAMMLHQHILPASSISTIRHACWVHTPS